jgi:hypothetical protein
MTLAEHTHEDTGHDASRTPTGAPWQATYTHLQREVSRLTDAATEAQRAYRTATERADAAGMLAARRRYLEASAALTETRAALAVADANLRLEQAQQRLTDYEAQQRAPGPPGALARTMGGPRAYQSLVDSVRDARRGVEDASAQALQRLR